MGHLAKMRLHDLADASKQPQTRNPLQPLTLFRVGLLRSERRRDLCLVKKVASRAALVHSYASQTIGARVQLELEDQAPIDAVVKVVDGHEVELAFVKAVDVLTLLKFAAGAPPPRMPRIDVRAFALIRQGATSHRVTVQNISQGGISALHDSEFDAGAPATVSLRGLPPQPSVVRWSGPGICGVTFNAVLGLPQLVEWLHAHSSEPGLPL